MKVVLLETQVELEQHEFPIWN